MAQTTISLHGFTKLPLEEFSIDGRTGIAAKITTPHKGEVIINYEKEVLRGWFIFGHTEKENKLASELISQVINLENEAKDFLLNKWLQSLN